MVVELFSRIAIFFKIFQIFEKTVGSSLLLMEKQGNYLTAIFADLPEAVRMM